MEYHKKLFPGILLLAPDQLLILVNGTRRHNAAYMNNGTLIQLREIIQLN
jgi:hypothetical protein